MPHRASSPAVSENEFDITKSLFKDDEGDDGDNFGVSSGNVGDLDTGGIFDLALESDGEGDEAFIAATQAASNRKTSNVKGKSVKKGGGFQAMGMNLLQRRWFPSLILSRLEFAPPESDQSKRILCSYPNSKKNDTPCAGQSRCCWHGKDWLWKDCRICDTDD
jgi:hypothetical protein